MASFLDKCHCCYELAFLRFVDEAGQELCEHCARTFYEAFYRAEAAAEGDR